MDTDIKLDGPMNCGKMYSFYMMGVLSPSSNMRPFDTVADGMVWGEAMGKACFASVLQAKSPRMPMRQCWHQLSIATVHCHRVGITTQGSLSVMVSVISCRVQSNSF